MLEVRDGKRRLAAEDHRLNMAIGRYSMKVRARKVDPLHEIIKVIQGRDLIELKTQLRSKTLLLLFKERLLASRVPKDHSPLVEAILKGDFNMFSYIIENFPFNIEQETSAVIEGGYPVEGASPLWTASTLGKLEFVKLLVAHGADIEHTTDSKSSPLRGAAFDGHCTVCEFLISRGADIDKPNQVGQSPLTIAAAMQKKECVELLISKGADVNHKGHNGDTPLHVSVESGAVEIAKLLVDAGAKNDPNDVGFTPAILACCYGHKEVMKFLNTVFQLPVRELYDCYCLLAAKEVLGSNSTQAEIYMRMSLEIRLANKELFCNFPPADPIYDHLQEPTSMHELRNILTDETHMFFVSSIYCERILGRVHPTTAFYIRISGDMVLADDRYKKCIDLWHRSLEFDDAARMAYELQITEDLLFTVRGFSIMCSDGFIPPVQPHFRWGLKELRMAHESKIPEVAVISCLFRMIAVWIKVTDHIKDEERAVEERLKIVNSVDELIDAMDGNRCSVLIACLQNLPEHNSGAGKDIIKIDIPLHRAIAVFLDRGCSLYNEDDQGNFPLHLAVKMLDRNALKCVRTLLDYGAHHDAVNFNKQMALDVARCQYIPSQAPPSEVVDELTRVAASHLSLQCLAARAIVKHRLPYQNVLPQRVFQFVAWHEGDCGSIAHASEDWARTEAQCPSKRRVVGMGSDGVVSKYGGSAELLPQESTATMNGFILPHTNGLNSNTKESEF